MRRVSYSLLCGVFYNLLACTFLKDRRLFSCEKCKNKTKEEAKSSNITLRQTKH